MFRIHPQVLRYSTFHCAKVPKKLCGGMPLMMKKYSETELRLSSSIQRSSLGLDPSGTQYADDDSHVTVVMPQGFDPRGVPEIQICFPAFLEEAETEPTNRSQRSTSGLDVLPSNSDLPVPKSDAINPQPFKVGY